MGQFSAGRLDKKRNLNHRSRHLDQVEMLSEDHLNNRRILSVVPVHLLEQVSRTRALSGDQILDRMKDLAVKKANLANGLLKEIADMETSVNSATKQETAPRVLLEEVSDRLHPHRIHLVLRQVATFLRLHPFQQARLELVLRLATR